MDLSLVSQEEFQPEEDRYGIDRGISLRELGQQRQWTAQIRRLICGEPHVDTP
jgi:hypothetical protein